MNGRTEVTAAITAILNGLFGLLSALGIWSAPPELIGAVNGILGPMIIFFLANRVTKVENQAVHAANSATNAAVDASRAASTAARVENKVAS